MHKSIRMEEIMRKKLFTLAAAMMALTVMLTGCGSNDGDSKEVNQDSTKESTDKKEESGYAFTVDGVKINVDVDFAPLLEKLGEPLSVFEAESCAAQGIGRTYTYADFIIDTYPDGDTDRVLCIILRTDNVATEEGIDLSMTKDEIIAKYGEPDKQNDISIGYSSNGMRLSFIFEGDSLLSIQYDSSLNL